MSEPSPRRDVSRFSPGWDALLLAVLVVALLQITGLAEQAALPNRVQDVLRHPILGNLLPAAGAEAMGEVGPRPGDPVGLLLNALALALLIGYLLADLAFSDPVRTRWKSWLLAGILLTTVLLPTSKLVLLRQANGPASYTHDGGVIQTEATIRYLLDGKNPYTEDYVNTPMADWGFSRYRTALYHYPYLPWTFLFSAPFFLAGQSVGFYDQRMVYVLLLVVTLALAPRLAQGNRAKLALVALLGLNPIMALDVIFGQNDSFVLCWIVLSLICWGEWIDSQRQGRRNRWALPLSAVLFGLACASKPTAWFLAPFYGLLLIADDADLAHAGLAGIARRLPVILRRAAPALIVFVLVLLPYLLWDPISFYDDIWRWSNGQGDTGYQIWGWGASNFVLALGWVSDRFAEWPFWIPELLIATPLLIWFLRRQRRSNTLGNACWHYGLFLLVFFYVSRFLNENYLGYVLAFLSLGVLGSRPRSGRDDGRLLE